MAECTDAERKFLDDLQRADAYYVWFDDDKSSRSWIRGFDQRPPGHINVDYGHIDGERQIRRLTIKIGLTAKQFDAAVEAGKEADRG